MTFAIFFVLVCLGPVAILCEDLSWIPDRIPRRAQQCKNLGTYVLGECIITAAVARTAPGYHNTGICASLKCAVAKPLGGHFLHRGGRPKDGTPCGILKACKGGSCIDIPAHRVPIAEGSDDSFDCRP